ncbi:MAG TPA: hypothetical protein PKA90_13315 [Ignavibacteria bacterium]|nr:hypothetical protein [Ignavibacteria bacterium]HMR41398.1 hypothetical protein [Ignavibacteria bacterium]
MLRYYFFYSLILGLLIYSYGCDVIVSNQSKPDVPADHTILHGIFLHKSGEREAIGCSDCHGQDLKGGVQLLGNTYIYTQSCYQCHNKLWDTRGSK